MASVMDYGAVGNGVTDDTAAFNNALAANAEVTVPSNTYAIGGAITIPTGKRIFGDSEANSILRRTPGTTSDQMLHISGRMERLTVDGNWPATTGTIMDIVMLPGGVMANITWRKGSYGLGQLDSNTSVTDCTFIGAGLPSSGAAWGFWFGQGGLSNITIQRCTFSDLMLNALFGGANGMLIEGCTFNNNHCQIVPTGGGQVDIIGDSQNVVIHSCSFGTGTGGVSALEIDSVNGITVSHCEINAQTYSGIVLQTSNVHNPILEYNNIHDCGGYGIVTALIDNLTMRGNTFTNNAGGNVINATNLDQELPSGPMLASLQMDQRSAAVTLG